MALEALIAEYVGPQWGPIVPFLWLLWQLYCPFPNHETKLQTWFGSLTERFDRVEKGQIALAEEIRTVDEGKFREIHEGDELTTSAFKDEDGSDSEEVIHG